jgi:hypothetical protein
MAGNLLATLWQPRERVRNKKDQEKGRAKALVFHQKQLIPGYCFILSRLKPQERTGNRKAACHQNGAAERYDRGVATGRRDKAVAE